MYIIEHPDPVVVLVHSPLVGPLTWRPVADRLAAHGWPVAVPDLVPAMAGPAPYQPRIAQTVAGTVERLVDRRQALVLVGHSGAGPLLPGIADTLPAPVRALVYVDAGLPHPGRTWFETAPADLADHLRGLAKDGRLPPWHEWFPPELLTTLMPDPQQRARFTAELTALPLDYFHEPMPEHTWSGPTGYLLLSDAYRDDARSATQDGAVVVERVSHHLAPLTDPGPVTTALQELLSALDRPDRR